MQRSLSILIPLALVAALAMTLPAAAQSDNAIEIISKSLENRKVKNSIQTISMTIEEVKRDGSVRSGKPRVMLSKIRDDEDAMRSYIRFNAPSDMAGVQFVSVSPKKGETEQFMYFPPPDELLTRISGSGRAGRFFGSDFAYEDMEISSVDDAVHSSAGEETITIGKDTLNCWKIESVPKPEAKSSYSKIVSWIDKSNNVARQVLFFDKKGRELKRMQVLQVAKDGEFFIPIDTLMEGLQRTTRTKLHVDDYKTNVPDSELPLEMFTEAYVKSQG